MTPGSARRSERHLSGISHQLDGKYFLTAFALLLLSVGVGGYFTVQSAQSLYPAPRTITEFIQYHMSMTRVVLGAVVILCSPLLLNITLRIYSVRPRCSGNRIALIALIPPGLAFPLSWLHPMAFAATLVVPAVALWVLLRRGMSLGTAPTFSVGLTHAILSALLVIFGLWALESLQTERTLNPIAEYRALRNAVERLRAEDVTTVLNSDRAAPRIRWESTGSDWLDFRANRAQVEVRGDYPDEQLVQLVILEKEQNALSGDIDDSRWRSPVFAPQAEATYQLHIVGGLISGTQVRVRSLVPPTLY